MSSLIPIYDPILFSEIHQLSTFLPPDENEESIRFIIYITGIITAIHCSLYIIVKLWKGSRKGDGESSGKNKVAKASYQLTNLLVNLTFGCLGIYYQINILTNAWGESTMNKIVGYEHVKLFAMGQVGYQLWALPIGIFVVGETKSMLMHHVAVICVGSVSTFIRCGFRYYIPYFYGLVEISSVPLSILNSFKNNKEWIKAYPELYSAVRLVFAVAFLLVRVVLWTPFFWSFFSNATMLLYSSESTLTMVILTCFILSGLILTFLQYFWASKIISTMIKGAQRKKKEN